MLKSNIILVKTELLVWAFGWMEPSSRGTQNSDELCLRHTAKGEAS